MKRTITEFAGALRARAIIAEIFDPEQGLEYLQTRQTTYPGRNTEMFCEVSLSYCIDGDWRQRSVVFGVDQDSMVELDYLDILKESIEVQI